MQCPVDDYSDDQEDLEALARLQAELYAVRDSNSRNAVPIRTAAPVGSWQQMKSILFAV